MNLLPIGEKVTLKEFKKLLSGIVDEQIALDSIQRLLDLSLIKLYFTLLPHASIESANTQQLKQYYFPKLVCINNRLDSNYLHNRVNIFHDDAGLEVIEYLGEFSLLPWNEYQIRKIIFNSLDENDFDVIAIDEVSIEDRGYPVRFKKTEYSKQVVVPYLVADAYLKADEIIKYFKKYHNLVLSKVNEESSEWISIQEQRELVLEQWLENKNRDEVSMMTKAEVWKQLQLIDPKLFNANMPVFFKKQKLISFKVGSRKKS